MGDDGLLSQRPTKVGAGRAVALFICYSFAPVFLGIALALASFFFFYGYGDRFVRPSAASLVFLGIMLAGWFSMPRNRPHPGALGIQILMCWALLFGAGIVRVHLHGSELSLVEWMVVISCAAVFVAGAYVSRRTKWGKRIFARRIG